MARGHPAVTGRTLGDFTVLEKLGEGAYGVVHRAEQRGLGREAVVKVMRPRQGDHERAVQRFLREAQLASRLDHPYAAHIYAFGAEPDGLLWIAMELVRGTPLSRWLEAQPGGRLPLVRWVPLLDRICEVVHTAHEQGIVHRDLKPDNIMVLSRAGRLLPKLLDLGVAKLAIDRTGDGGETSDEADPRLTRDGARVGSPRYMAPEQWRDGEIDARTDLYALGVMTYEVLVGRVPFDGASVAEIAAAHRSAPLPPVPELIGPELAAAIEAATAKDRDARPASVLVFADAVRAAAGLRAAPDALPRLDDSLRQEIAWLPQPIAEAIGAFEAARNPHQARDAVWQVVDVAARWLGVIALAARGRIGPGPGRPGDPPALIAALRELHRRELSADEWLALVRELVRPFAAVRDAYPVPPLVDLALADASPFAPLASLRAEAASTTEESLREWLARAMPHLASLVRALAFLADYQLVRAQPDGAELWMGARALRRQRMHVDGELAIGEVALIDLDGRPVLALSPLVAIAAPSPAAADELFAFVGPGRARGRGARLVAEPRGFERHDDAVWSWFRAHLLSPEDGAAAPIERAPYLGLSAFTAGDADMFFGRERAAEAFANQLLATPLLAVVGPSGAGKSSFVQAGVLPLLPASWRAIVMRPGPAPLATLRAKAGDPIAPADGETLVVIVDQFEELFTLGADADVRARFAAALAEAAERDRVRVVITMRDDFLARAGELAALRDRLAQAIVLVGTPAPDDLLRIVVEPARRAGYDFDDPELPARMVRGVAGQPGALAMVSFAAARLWELRDRHFKRLTRKAYDAIGGIEGALAAHAEATLAAAGADEQRLVREAFRHLITAEGTRAAITRRELEDVVGDRAREVVERLVRARLLVTSEGEAGDDRIEIVHEALVTAWPRLVEWRRADAEGARLRDQLRTAARQWADRGRPGGLLWRDDALDDYRRWRARWSGALPELDLAFAAASLRAAARSRRRRRALIASAAAVLVSATLALALLYRASRDNAAESRQRLISSEVEQGRGFLLDGDYLRALPYLSAAYGAGEDGLALRVMLHRALRLAEAPAWSGAVADGAFRDATHLLLVDLRGEMTIRDLATGGVIARVPAALPAGAAPRTGTVSANGARAAFPADDAVVVWDGANVTRLPVPGAQWLALDRDGAHVAIADGKTIASWDAARGRLDWQVAHAGTVAQLAWVGGAIAGHDRDGAAYVATAAGVAPLAPTSRLITGAGDVLATIGDGTVEIWDARGQHLRTLETANAFGGAFTRDGRTLAVVARTGAIRLFDVATGRDHGVLAGHRGLARAIFTPKGDRLVTIGDDRTVRIWDVAHRSQLFAWTGAASSTLGYNLDPAAARVVVTAAGGVRVFALDDPGARTVIDTGAAIYASGFAGGGERVYTTSDHGVSVWDAATGAAIAHVDVGPADGTHLDATGARAIVPLDGTTDAQVIELATGARGARIHAAAPLDSAAFDRAGARAVTTADDGAVDLWDARGAHLATLAGHTGVVYAAAFSPDGARVAAAGYTDTTLIIWDAATGRELARAREPDSLYTVAFDGAGDELVTASDDGRATLWDARTLAPIRSFDHDQVVRAAAIDGAGALVAGATRDGTISLWDVASGKELTRFHHGAMAMSVDFAPGGARLVSGSLDGREVVWDAGAQVPSPGEVAAFVACHVPYELRGTSLDARELPACAATPSRR